MPSQYFSFRFLIRIVGMLLLVRSRQSAVRAFSSIPIRRTATSKTTLSSQRPSTIMTDTTTTTTTTTNNTNGSTIIYDSTRTISTPSSSSSSSPSSTTTLPKEMTEDQKYLFDLNGYIVIRNVLTPEEVKAANDAIDKHSHKMIERNDNQLRNAKKGTRMYGTGPGRKDLGGVLEWDINDSKIFKSILAHPKLVPLFHGILGKGYRMDHLPFVLAQDYGAEGFSLHGGTIDCSSGQYNPHLAYTCMHGTIRSSLLGCNVMLTDHNYGDGGFCIVPGSHKSNFKMPKNMIDGEEYSEFIQQPVTKAGDVVLFSEGTVHGALPWTCKERQRRACLYRFAPATMSYGRSYFGHEGGGWPDAMYEGLTDGERAVLEPPYANRLDRPNIQHDGSVEITQRSERKRQHDQDVFGTKYF